jgi:hypothetical protein
MELSPLERRTGLTKEEFGEEYLKKGKPVIFTDLVSDWPTVDKWSFDYLISEYGTMNVPVCDNSFREPGKKYLSPNLREMPFGEYLSLIQEKPTDLRIFLYNIMAHAPGMANDVRIPTIMDGFVKNMPFMFFGGKGSYVGLHYDLDCSNVFLTQFQTRKRVVLFSPEQSRALYQHPFTVQSQIDIKNPDYAKYPAARVIEGYECILTHGETLFMPSRYWHYIEYVEAGFSVSLRAFSSNASKLYGVASAAKNLLVDRGMNMMLGERWRNVKERTAVRRAGTLDIPTEA